MTIDTSAMTSSMASAAIALAALFDSLDNRLDMLEPGVADLLVQLGLLDSRVDTHDTQLATLDARLAAVEASGGGGGAGEHNHDDRYALLDHRHDDLYSPLGHTHPGSGGGASMFVNVKDFGALGNGIADDTAAIQAAINAAVTTGGTVYLPPGVYIISASLQARANITIMGEFGAAVLHQKANTPLPNGIIDVSGVPVFFRLKDLILSGNRVQQGGDLTSKGLNVHPLATSSGFNGASKVPNPNSQINDSCGRIEDVLCINIAGKGIVATGSGCHWLNVEARACSGIGIDNGQNDSVWTACSAGATDHEAWACWGGSARYYGCKGWWCGLGFNPATGTYGAYNRGGAFRIVNGNQLFSGCEGQESDGPAFMVQAPNITLSGCQATQACNLKGASTAIGQSPVRGGGYSVTQRTAVWLASSAKYCSVDVLVRDKFVGGVGAPNLASFVRADGAPNLITVIGDPAIRAAGAPIVSGTLTGNNIRAL